MTENHSKQALLGLPDDASQQASENALLRQIEGSRRRNPVELVIFSSLPAETLFTTVEWQEWSQLVLIAIELMKPSGFKLSNSDFSTYRFISTCDDSLAGQRPIIKMLHQLSNEGLVELSTITNSFFITTKARNCLSAIDPETDKTSMFM